MTTEDGALLYWEASLAWRGIRVPPNTTVETLFRVLDPLYSHRSSPLSRQSTELGDMIVKFKTKRPKLKGQRKIVQLPVLQKKAVAA